MKEKTLKRGAAWFMSVVVLAGCDGIPVLGINPAQTAYAWSDEEDSDFVIDGDGVLTTYLGDGGDVVIPDGVTAIGDGAFSGCVNLISVSIPEGLTEIGDDAFENCHKLKDVTLPESLTSIGGYAFYECSNLTEMTLPKSLTSIDIYAFAFCDGIKDLIIPGSVTSIGEYAFYDCDGFGTVIIEEGVKTIGDNAFAQCGDACRIVLPSSLSELGTDIVDHTGSIFCIKGSAAETYLDDNYGSDSYEYYSLVDEDALTILYTKANLEGNETLKVTDISDSKIVQECDAVKAEKIALAQNFAVNQDGEDVSLDGKSWISIPKEIEEAGIYQIYRLSENGETEYIDTVFLMPEDLAKAYHEDGEIGKDTWCSNLGRVNYVTDDEKTEIELDTASIYIEIKAEELGNFVVAESDFVIIDGVLRQYTGSSTNVVIPDGVTEIAQGAFLGNTTVERIVIPDSVKKIGYEAFSGCSSLKCVVIKAASVRMGQNAFSGADPMIFWNGTLISDSEEQSDVTGDAYTRYTFLGGDGEMAVLLDQKDLSKTGTWGMSYSYTADAGEKAEFLEEQGASDYILGELSVTLGGNELELEGPATVYIKVPEGMDEDTCGVYRLDDNDIADMKAEVKQGYLVFDTDCLGTYLITCDEVIVSDENLDDDTDDNPTAGDVEDDLKTDILYGDVNDDGAIDAKDAVLLKRYCANWTVTLNETAADANQDGTIDTKDAVLVRRCAAGWNVLGN